VSAIAKGSHRASAQSVLKRAPRVRWSAEMRARFTVYRIVTSLPRGQVPEGLSDAHQVAKLCEIIAADELAALSMRTPAVEDGAAVPMDEPGDELLRSDARLAHGRLSACLTLAFLWLPTNAVWLQLRT